MSRAVLISIRPEWIEKIANGIKTVEVRKSRPKIKTPFKCYIYCTMGGGWLTSVNGVVQKPNGFELDLNVDSVINELNGYVIGEFVCDKIYNIFTFGMGTIFADETFLNDFNETEIDQENMLKKTCLTFLELEEYRKGKDCYGWHISDIAIYDKPKEITEFKHECNGACLDNKKGVVCEKVLRKEEKVWNGCDRLLPIKRPPQSWAYLEEIEE